MRLDDVDPSDIEVRRGGVGRKVAVGGGLDGLLLVLLVNLLLGGSGGGNNDLGDVLGQLQAGGGVSAEGEMVKGNTLEGQEQFGAKTMTLLGDYWKDEAGSLGFNFSAPGFVVFDSPTQTGGCGVGRPEAGPFYCPGDRKIFIDFGLYRRLESQLGFDGDFDEAIRAANAVGDDAIQGAGASRDTFTHGSSAEREKWFRQGFDSADPASCRTGA